MTMAPLHTSFAALLFCSMLLNANAQKLDPSAHASGEWRSVTPEVEVKWGNAKNPQHQRQLEHAQQRFLGSSSSFKSGMNSPFVNGNEVYYDDYSQAWRMLGFYMDCNSNESYMDADGDGSGDRRQLSGDDGRETCQRYLLWAAYVDLDHKGDGLYEYIMWDPKNKNWNTDGCRYDPTLYEDDDEMRERYESKYRCVKMDCHLEDATHFELLGIFKEPGHEDWFEQLFKHEGYCVWTEDEYNFMQTYREVWPDECTELESTDEKGNALYYHIKPMENALMDIGVYTDKYCSKDYTGKYTTENLLDGVLIAEYAYGNNDDGNNNDDGDYDYNNNYYYNGDNSNDLLKYMDKWNELLSIYTVCQPCLAYTPAWMVTYQSNNGNQNRRRESSDDEDFECADDAGYNNVNQCMKFATHTDMEVAYSTDVLMAARQGSITSIPSQLINAKSQRQADRSYRKIPVIFWWALGYLGVASLLYMKAVQVRARVRRERAMKEPFLQRVKSGGSKRSSASSKKKVRKGTVEDGVLA